MNNAVEALFQFIVARICMLIQDVQELHLLPWTNASALIKDNLASMLITTYRHKIRGKRIISLEQQLKLP